MTLGCLLLAAGGSRRLGRPKLLLPYRGRPLLDTEVGVRADGSTHPELAAQTRPRRTETH